MPESATQARIRIKRELAEAANVKSTKKQKLQRKRKRLGSVLLH